MADVYDGTITTAPDGSAPLSTDDTIYAITPLYDGGRTKWPCRWQGGRRVAVGDACMVAVTDDRPWAAEVRNTILAPSASVSVLPTIDLYDGREVLFQTQVMATAGFGAWRVRYRALNPDGSANASTHKWEPIGAPALFAEVTTEEATAVGVYNALATAGPAVALPLAGDYIVEIGHTSLNSTVGQELIMSYEIGATAASDADMAIGNADTVNRRQAFARAMRKTGLAAVTLTAKYRTGGGTATFGRRWMRATPLQVG